MLQVMVKQDSKEIEKAFRHVFPERGLQVVKFGTREAITEEIQNNPYGDQ